jgi:hypothetical protein
MFLNETSLETSLSPEVLLPLEAPQIVMSVSATKSQVVSQPVLPVKVVIAKNEKIPDWVIQGILQVETRSSIGKNGNIKYVDKRRGLAGERGPFQMRKCSFDTIKKRGDQFWMLETDTEFAQEKAEEYLMYLYDHHANKNWKTTVAMWNTGPNAYNGLYNIGRKYASLVYKKGLKLVDQFS